MIALMIFLLISLNLGGFTSLFIDIGQGKWLTALTNLVMMGFLNWGALWLLRDMRENE